VQENMGQYEGMKTFKVLATDSTASCVGTRRLISVENPGLVSLRD